MIECMFAKKTVRNRETETDKLYCYPTGYEGFTYDKSKVQKTKLLTLYHLVRNKTEICLKM